SGTDVRDCDVAQASNYQPTSNPGRSTWPKASSEAIGKSRSPRKRRSRSSQRRQAKRPQHGNQVSRPAKRNSDEHADLVRRASGRVVWPPAHRTNRAACCRAVVVRRRIRRCRQFLDSSRFDANDARTSSGSAKLIVVSLLDLVARPSLAMDSITAQFCRKQVVASRMLGAWTATLQACLPPLFDI